MVAHINLAKGFRGGERQTAILIEELSKLGYHQKLFYRDKSLRGLAYYLQSRDIANLEMVHISKPYILHIPKFRGVDIVHAHEAKALQLAYFIKKILGIPYITTRRVQFTPKNNFFNRAIYKNAKSVVALSSAIRDDLQKLDSDLQIDIIPSAYYQDKDLKDEPLPQEFRDKKIVGHIGAVVDSHKGQCTILKSAELIAKERDDIHFVLIGDGVDLDSCKERAKALKNITFLGYLDNPQRFINSFDIFIFPSNHEGLGSTLLDVMVKGVPIIASKVGGIVDIIEDNFNGYLLKSRDAEELKNRILNLLSDSETQQKFRNNSLKRVEKFSPEEMAKRYNILYRPKNATIYYKK